MKKIKIYQVDAFSKNLFSGNPAAICPLADWLDDKVMQSIAMENNLSETSFFIIKDNKYYIRWFTPVTEIGLAGHPTLATAHIIFQEMSYKKNKIEFHTKSGDILTVIKKENILSMDFPSYNSICLDEKLGEISKALRAKPKKFFLSKYGMAIYEKEQDIIDISPDFEKLSKIDNIGIIATAPGNNNDFVSRFFAPKLGIQEDPVTGSAHCQLIPYWSKVLNKKNMLASQLSQRGGELHCTYLGRRVLIGGCAVTYMIGELMI